MLSLVVIFTCSNQVTPVCAVFSNGHINSLPILGKKIKQQKQETKQILKKRNKKKREKLKVD